MAEFTETTTKTVNCPSCQDGRVMKVGKRSGYQRYQCRGCNKKFRDNGTTKGHQFNAEVIGATIRDFYMGLSYKQLAEGMEHRYDISEPSKDSLYNWVKKYTDVGHYIQKDYPAHTGDHWVIDEMVVQVNGENLWHWNVMDKKTRYALASRLVRHRNIPEAVKTLRMARAAADRSPQTITTDGLPAYPRAIKDTFPGATHVVSEGIYEIINNNMSERLQGTYRSRVKTLRGMDSIETGQRYLDGYTLTYNYFREHESLGYKTPGEVAKTGFPHKEWADIVESGIEVPESEKPKASLPGSKRPRKKTDYRRRRKASAPKPVLPKQGAAQPEVQLPLFVGNTIPKSLRSKPKPAGRRRKRH